MPRPVPIVLALALLALAPAAAAESQGYHLFGDVVLDGAPKEGAVLHVVGGDAATRLEIPYGGEQETPAGRARLMDKLDENGRVVEGRLHYYVDVPTGRYTLRVVSDGREASAEVETTSTATAPLPWGTYALQQVPEMRLAQARAPPQASPAERPDAQEGAQPESNATHAEPAQEPPANDAADPAPQDGAPESTPPRESAQTAPMPPEATHAVPGAPVALLLVGVSLALRRARA